MQRNNPKYIQNRIDNSTNKIVKQMWLNALKNLTNPRKSNVTWDLYFLTTGYIIDTKLDKRTLAIRKNK